MIRRGMVFVLAVGTGPAMAWGQSSDQAVRRELIQRAQAEAAAGHHEDALGLAQRAAAIEASTSLRAFLVREQRATGRVAEALDNAEQCGREATANVSLPDRSAILSFCQQSAAALAGQVGHVTVVVPSPAPADLQVTVAGAPLRAALWGVGYITNPGVVEVRAEAPGVRPFVRVVTVEAGGTATVTVVFEALPSPEPAIVAPTVVPLARPSPPHPVPLAPLVVAGLGVVTLGVALVLDLAVADPAFASFERQQCLPPGYGSCYGDALAHQQHDAAAALDTGTWITAVAGGALVVGGFVGWVATRGRRDGVRPLAQVAPNGVVTVGLGGTW